MEPYFNTFTLKMEQWDPSRGLYALALKAEQSLLLDCGDRLDLGFGCLSAPRGNRSAAFLDFLKLVDKWPELNGRLRMVIVPCACSSPDCWKEVKDCVLLVKDGSLVLPSEVHRLNQKQSS